MIRICTPEPSVPHVAGENNPVKETAGVLLRILLLSPDPKVRVDAAVAVMPIAKSSIGRYVAELRDAFGDNDLVVRKNGIMQYMGDRSQTDAAAIEETHREVTDIVKSADGIAAVAGDILPKLQTIIKLYGGNPAMGLSAFSTDDIPSRFHQWAMELEQAESHWAELWSSVQLMFADCQLSLRPSKQTGADLLKGLFELARDRDPVEEVFPRLLQAARMSGDVRQHRNAWELTQRFYREEQMDFPTDLAELAPPTPKVASTPWEPHRARPLATHLESGDSDPIHEIARVLGITSVLKLRGEEVEPAECIERTAHRLWFSGVLASKWVIDAGIRSAFDQLLTKLDEDESSDVRFLIIDPDGTAYQRLYQLRAGKLSKDSVPHLQRLAANHASFSVRVVNALPAFRIVLIDNDFVTFSPYALEDERYATSKLGWDAPHIMLDPLAPYPLSDAFRLYFEERWSTAKDLKIDERAR